MADSIRRSEEHPDTYSTLVLPDIALIESAEHYPQHHGVGTGAPKTQGSRPSSVDASSATSASLNQNNGNEKAPEHPSTQEATATAIAEAEGGNGGATVDGIVPNVEKYEELSAKRKTIIVSALCVCSITSAPGPVMRIELY